MKQRVGYWRLIALALCFLIIVSCTAPEPAAATSLLNSVGCSAPVEKTFVVSIAPVKNDNIPYAVEEAIDLLGGIETVAAGKEQIMLKPNLVAESPSFTTNP